MKILFIILLHVSTIFASSLDDIDVKLTAILHNETEQMLGREGDENLSSERNSFSSLYAHLVFDYDINEDFFLSLGAKANGVLGEDNYVTPFYLRTKMTSDDINRAIVSEASVNYDNDIFSLSLGRQDIHFDWLLGSIDGALAMLGSDDDISLRLFWFDSYRHLQYNYYMEIEDINNNKGMYGSIFKANSDYAEVTIYDYFVEDLRNILGTDLSLFFDNVGLNLSYTSAKALDLALYDYDESFLNASIEYLYGYHYTELGISQTGENGLLAMIQMGSFMFGQFYLSNQVDRENALNAYLKYIYVNSNWRLELIGGQTQYDNSFVRLEEKLKAYEADIYIKYYYNDFLSLDIGAMYMDVDERDPLQVDQALVMLNVVLSYENY